jgi:DNA-binding CsgD family transcriptional regulator
VTSRSVDAETVDLIGRIYDSVIEPPRWHDTLERLRLHFGFHNAALSVNILPSGKGILSIAANFPPAYAHLADKHGPEIIELWGGPARVARAALEEPLLMSRAGDPSRWADNAYFRDFSVPQGIVDTVGVALARDPTTIAALGMGVHASAKPPDEAVFDGLRVVTPHLRRAVIIGRMLNVSDAAAHNFAAALDASRAAVVLVDASMHILQANAAAGAMLAAGDPIRETHGVLELATDLVPGALAGAVRGAADGGGAIGGRGIGIPTRRRDGSPLTLHVMPLAGRAAGPQDLLAVAAIFVGDAAVGVPPPSGVLSILFDLTPAEARVFELVVDGYSTAEITDQLTIAPSTLKTHLSRVYVKTGRSDRIGLVRLAREISLPG